MKKKTKNNLLQFVAILVILAACAFTVPKQDNPPQPSTERTYQVTVPEHLIGAFYNVLNGNLTQVSVTDYKEVMDQIGKQVQEQAAVYQKEDEVRKVKDSLTKKTPVPLPDSDKAPNKK